MNNWVIVGIIAGLLILGGIAFATAISSNQADTEASTVCLSCGGKCTAEKNCGLAACGAVNGKKCGCGR